MRSVLSNGTTVVFRFSQPTGCRRSLCPRSLLLNHGRLTADGPTTKIVHTYMEQIERRASRGPKTATPRSCRCRSAVRTGRSWISGRREDAGGGQDAGAQTDRAPGLPAVYSGDAVVLPDLQHLQRPAWVVRLLRLQPDEEYTCTFEMELESGIGHVSVFHASAAARPRPLVRDIEPVASIMVTSPIEVGGSANLYPRSSSDAPAMLGGAPRVTERGHA